MVLMIEDLRCYFGANMAVGFFIVYSPFPIHASSSEDLFTLSWRWFDFQQPQLSDHKAFSISRLFARLSHIHLRTL